MSEKEKGKQSMDSLWRELTPEEQVEWKLKIAELSGKLDPAKAKLKAYRMVADFLAARKKKLHETGHYHQVYEGKPKYKVTRAVIVRSTKTLRPGTAPVKHQKVMASFMKERQFVRTRRKIAGRFAPKNSRRRLR